MVLSSTPPYTTMKYRAIELMTAINITAGFNSHWDNTDKALRATMFAKKTSTNSVSKVQIPPGEEISRLLTANL